MTQQMFDARDLWASQGTPYVEPDIIEPVFVANIRTMVHAAQWRAYLNLFADVTQRRPLFLTLSLAANATVVTP